MDTNLATGLVKKWLDGGGSSWGVPEASIRHLLSEHAELVEALREASLQLVYLSEKFGETGTGNATLAKIDALIAKATAP